MFPSCCSNNYVINRTNYNLVCLLHLQNISRPSLPPNQWGASYPRSSFLSQVEASTRSGRRPISPVFLVRVTSPTQWLVAKIKILSPVHCWGSWTVPAGQYSTSWASSVIQTCVATCVHATLRKYSRHSRCSWRHRRLTELTGKHSHAHPHHWTSTPNKWVS